METTVLKQHRTALVAVAYLAFSTTLASAQTQQVVVNQITVRGTVEAVDHAARTVRIRGDQGNVITVDVPKSVTRFDQVKVGDIVTTSYFDTVSVRPKPAGEPPVDRTVPPTTTPIAGALPGATVASQRVTTVTLTAWDPATRTVSFTDPAGTSYTRRLLATTDASILAGLKVGDRVDVTRSEATTIEVQAGTATESLRDRLTISVLFGIDNQFSGKLIQEASGQTVDGRAIELEETTYDEVYGRMGLFKVGIGYRLSPRSEGVFNFVISRSSAEEVTVGTIEESDGEGTENLVVGFDDLDYWGIEGGQRFFFTRVRLTPFVGYLVGLNRYGDIRGNFVGVPEEDTPGLAEQDGKFFEKSWAFSFGPTFGVLIGLGPFELMAETQLRFMGGLSDVDWLVEEGLRDINEESSRWSLPILVGGRIRF